MILYSVETGEDQWNLVRFFEGQIEGIIVGKMFVTGHPLHEFEIDLDDMELRRIIGKDKAVILRMVKKKVTPL